MSPAVPPPPQAGATAKPRPTAPSTARPTPAKRVRHAGGRTEPRRSNCIATPTYGRAPPLRRGDLSIIGKVGDDATIADGSSFADPQGARKPKTEAFQRRLGTIGKAEPIAPIAPARRRPRAAQRIAVLPTCYHYGHCSHAAVSFTGEAIARQLAGHTSACPPTSLFTRRARRKRRRHLAFRR